METVQQPKEKKKPTEVAKILREYARIQSDLSRISEISSGIIYILDKEGYFTFLNRAVEEILHYQPHELIGKHYSVVMPKGEYERVSREFVLPKYAGVVTGPDNAPRLFDERRTRGRRTRNLEVRLKTKDLGEVKVLTGDVAGIVSSEGAYDNEKLKAGKGKDASFLGSQGIIYDISRYKEIEQEKIELERYLSEMQRVESIGRFAGGVAHELNNKLGVVIGYAEILEKMLGGLDDEAGEHARAIAKFSRNAAELTSQLLSLSEQGKYESTEVDMNALVEKVGRLVKHTLSRQTKMRTILRAKTCLVQGDPTALQNAVISLVMKVGANSHRVGDVVFSTKSILLDEDFAVRHMLVGNRGEYVVLTVILRGEILTAEEREKVRRLFSGDISKVGEKLAELMSVHECIRKHKGFVETTDDDDGGLRFDMYLPSITQT